MRSTKRLAIWRRSRCKTQCALLSKEFGFQHISLVDVLHEKSDDQTKLGPPLQPEGRHWTESDAAERLGALGIKPLHGWWDEL